MSSHDDAQDDPQEDNNNDNDNDDTTDLPQILTHAALPTLIGNLDAGDVLECYAVTRMAPLHLGNHNETIMVSKSAIALRYPPPLGSSKAPLELTLEYGPQRMGSRLDHEAMPLLQQQEEFVTWENEGKVYYTTAFSTRDWTKANYMASLTGAVFELLLNKALVFAQQHTRYQPVRVVNDNNTVWLKSSASHDFVYSVWEGLATAGVELLPIMTPHTRVLRLHASNVEKVSGTDPEGRTVSRQAYDFYQKLYECATAIQTGNYKHWEPTASPSVSPTPTMTPTTTTPSMTPSDSPAPTAMPLNDDDASTESPTALPTNYTKKKKSKTKVKNNKNNNTTVDEHDTGTSEEPPPDTNDNPRRRRRLDGTDEDEFDDLGLPPQVHNTTNDFPSAVPSVSPEEEEEEESSGDEAAKAKEAAQHAKEAADIAKEAAQSPQDSKAADAAQEAATAAQAAADATSNAATKAAMEAFKSGDGAAVTTVLRECFEDPKYGIMQMITTARKELDDFDENEQDMGGYMNETTVTETYAYLYLDGSNYYRVNLTWPYMDVATLQRPLPQPPFGWDSGSVDAVDWLLALLVISLLAATVLALLQQIGFKICYVRHQKWFFSPRHYDEKSANTSLHVSKGQGYSHGFSEDVIPLSMGGRRGFVEPHHVMGDEIANVSVPEIGMNGNDHDTSVELGDLEMVVPQPPLQGTPGRSTSLSSPMASPAPPLRHGRSGSSNGVDYMEGDSEDESPVPRRLSRDPDLVDLPNLKSTSKVAIPVTRSNSTGGYSDSIH